ncbi:MAG: hypothetical protein HY827_08405 [Actinobacteria bacterium]|nr:hypothetical protein [Actinomycetota bacterium]
MNDQSSEPNDFRARARARGEAKNAEARAALVPLAPGERPVAVTVAAIVALVFAIFNVVVIFFVHVDTDKQSAAIVQQIFIAALLLVSAAGMWRTKYWAVLGFQTILALTVIMFLLALMKASSVWLLVPYIALIVGFSTLFWFLIRAMARIQMPESPAQRRLREQMAQIDRDNANGDAANG